VNLERSLLAKEKQVLHRKVSTNIVRGLRNTAGKEGDPKDIYYYEEYSSSIPRPVRG
jgi:hypothetical protein